MGKHVSKFLSFVITENAGVDECVDLVDRSFEFIDAGFRLSCVDVSRCYPRASRTTRYLGRC